jgi:murein DD-endopeptidase MepM/ murein hydrolase activator NlpD
MNVAITSNGPASGLVTSPAKLESQKASFQALLASILGSASPAPLAGGLQPVAPQSAKCVVVLQGDCLSRICSEQLKRAGQGVSQREIQAAVKEVAKANHISDPDRIYAGQNLDLSGLATYASAGKSSSAGIASEDEPRWKALVDGAASLSSGFGLRKDPFTGQASQHAGIDVAAPTGSSIHALDAGSVVFSGWKPGYGNTVIIRHEDGLESLYGHLSKSLVQVGDQVTCHGAIACVGSTGRSTGAHLHFEVRKNGKAVDPVPLLRRDYLQLA